MAAKRATKSTGKAEAKLSYATPALEKGLDVLELLAHQHEGLTKSQIARELNRTVSEIFRMLLCLERRGYITLIGGERYTLTLKMFKLVQEHPPTERLIADALPVMHHLSQATLQSCHLGVLEDARVTILAQVNAPASTGFFVKLGSTVELMEAASGYVIMAHQDERHRANILAEWSRQTGKQPPDDLGGHLTRIRKAGYEKQPSYLVKGVVNVSFPILDDRGLPLAALTIPYIQYNHPSASLPEVIEFLRAAAGEISAAIGGKQP